MGIGSYNLLEFAQACWDQTEHPCEMIPSALVEAALAEAVARPEPFHLQQRNNASIIMNKQCFI